MKVIVFSLRSPWSRQRTQEQQVAAGCDNWYANVESWTDD